MALCADMPMRPMRRSVSLSFQPADPAEIYPYTDSGKELYAFQNLRQSNGPFRKLVDSNTANLIPIQSGGTTRLALGALIC